MASVVNPESVGKGDPASVRCLGDRGHEATTEPARGRGERDGLAEAGPVPQPCPGTHRCRRPDKSHRTAASTAAQVAADRSMTAFNQRLGLGPIDELVRHLLQRRASRGFTPSTRLTTRRTFASRGATPALRRRSPRPRAPCTARCREALPAPSRVICGTRPSCRPRRYAGPLLATPGLGGCIPDRTMQRADRGSGRPPGPPGSPPPVDEFPPGRPDALDPGLLRHHLRDDYSPMASVPGDEQRPSGRRVPCEQAVREAAPGERVSGASVGRRRHRLSPLSAIDRGATSLGRHWAGVSIPCRGSA